MLQEKNLKNLTEKILNDLEFDSLPVAPECELSLLITSDSEIQKLNKEYRDKDKATDVLSFSMIEGLESPIPQPVLGDIVISLETAERQAQEHDVNLYQELLRLLIHGLLHLCGYDHEDVSEEEAKRMRDKEDELYEQYLELGLELFK